MKSPSLATRDESKIPASGYRFKCRDCGYVVQTHAAYDEALRIARKEWCPCLDESDGWASNLDGLPDADAKRLMAMQVRNANKSRGLVPLDPGWEKTADGQTYIDETGNRYTPVHQ